MPTDDDRFAITCNHCGEVYDKSDDARHDCQSDDDLDRAAPWAGYGWKIDELLDRAQAAEAEVQRLRARVAQLEGADPLDVFRPGGA